MPLVPLLEHKNADFVLERLENGGRRKNAHKNLDFVLGRKFRYGFETCADCSFKASCEKLAPFMENEVARKNMNL